MWCVQTATPMTVRKAFSKVSLKRWIVSYYLGAAYRYILCFVYIHYSFTVDSFDLFWFHDFHLQGRGISPSNEKPISPAKLADYGGSKSILGRSTTFQLWKLLCKKNKSHNIISPFFLLQQITGIRSQKLGLDDFFFRCFSPDFGGFLTGWFTLNDPPTKRRVDRPAPLIARVVLTTPTESPKKPIEFFVKNHCPTPKVSGTTGSLLIATDASVLMISSAICRAQRVTRWPAADENLKTLRTSEGKKGRKQIEITSNNKKSKQAAKQLTKYWFPNSLLHETRPFPLLFGFSKNLRQPDRCIS